MKRSLIEKKTRSRRLKSCPELTILNIGWGASLLIGLLILNGLRGKESADGGLGLIAFATLYFIAAIINFIMAVLSRTSVLKGEGIPAACRKLGYVALPFALTGNIFSAISGFAVVKEKKSVEYNLGYYALLNNLTAFLVSALNLFKDALADMFFLGMGLLGLSLVFYAIALLTVEKALENGRYERLKPLAIILMVFGLTGNLFSFLLGLVIVTKIRHRNDQRTVEWIDMIRRIFRNYMAVMGFFVISLLLTLAVCSYLTFNYQYAISNDYSNLLQVPSLKYPFGTDNVGLCVFTRIVFGTRISLIIGIAATAVPVVIGGLLGAAAGYYSERLDNGIMRVLDILYAVPSTLLTIAIVAAFGANTLNLIIALSISNIPIYARTMRAQVMTITNSEFVEASRACGRREHEILLKHVIPNSVAQVIVRASISIGIAVLSTSSLSYLGLGVEPHIPEWGNILKVGSPYLETNPYLAIYPGLFIVILVMAFNFLGDGLLDSLDPKLK